MIQENIIGVIGGMGPYAGLDLVRKIFDLTDAHKDQDHLPVALLSFPGRIRDRSDFLFAMEGENPADALFEIALRLERTGAVVVGMPCNTAHAPSIFDELKRKLSEANSNLRVINMIAETASYIREATEGIERIGVLSTLAVFRLELYSDALADAGFQPIIPDENVQENIINRAIFDSTFGIKAQANPVSMIARQSLLSAVAHLREKGAQAIILGCTELPIALPEKEIDSTIIIDPTRVLARALIRETNPDRITS